MEEVDFFEDSPYTVTENFINYLHSILNISEDVDTSLHRSISTSVQHLAGQLMKFMEGIGSNWSWTYCSFLFNCGAFCLLLTCRQRHLFSPGWEASVGEFGGKLANSAVSPSGRGCRYLGVALVCGREDRNWDHYGTKKLNISILTGGLSFPMCCSLEVSTQTLLIIGIIDLFSVANSFCSKTIRVAKTGPRHPYLDGEQHSKFHSVRWETPCRSSGGAGFELWILPDMVTCKLWLMIPDVEYIGNCIILIISKNLANISTVLHDFHLFTHLEEKLDMVSLPIYPALRAAPAAAEPHNAALTKHTTLEHPDHVSMAVETSKLTNHHTPI